MRQEAQGREPGEVWSCGIFSPNGMAAAPVTATPTRRVGNGRLFRKYVVIFVILVSGALLTSGALELYFSFLENKSALSQVQHEKANGAASRIEGFIAETERQILAVAQTPILPGAEAGDERRNELVRALRRAPAVTDLAYLDPSGHEQTRVSRLAMNVSGSTTDYSSDPRFQGARSGTTYFGPVYFRNESEPYMTVAARSIDGGVIVGEVNLKFIWDVVSRIRTGEAGYAYVVDRTGQLVAHPDISLVLRKTNLRGLEQVSQAMAGAAPATAGLDTSIVATDSAGRPVLAGYERIDRLGWAVIVEQPLSEAFAPLYASMVRTVLLLFVGLALAVGASLFLARRMITPIRALQSGATRIGAGQLDQRIEVHTGDELEALAESFNVMAARLHESYSTLEQKVEERTHQLEIANRHKSEFLANMSHELRTPLNAIIGFSEVLLERMFGELNERQEEYLNDVLSSGRHLLSLINDILDLSKVEAGRMELEPSEFSLVEALSNGLTMLRERAANHGIGLDLSVAPGLDVIEADERKVKQIVFNLLSNAVKFTPDGGRVDVAARQHGGSLEIAVRDTGIGIRSEEQAAVFEEFRQVGDSNRQKYEGTGLGLALCRRFVELHGGTIWVESEVGVGSTFTFTIPLRQTIVAAGAVVDGGQPERLLAVAPTAEGN